MDGSTERARAAGGRDAASWLFALSGVGEISVGVLVAIFPQVLGLLLGQPLDAAGAIAARLVGCAVLALGLSWWLARDIPQERRRLRPGMLVYDFGAAAVFLLAALQSPSPVLPGLVALLHTGLGILAAFMRLDRS